MNTNRSLPDLSIKKIWNKLFRHDNDIEVLQERPVNNNILINSNFANPVNQRGITFPYIPTKTEYSLDRWCGYSKMEKIDDYIRLSVYSDSSWIYQKIEFPELYIGKQLTVTLKVRNPIESNNWYLYSHGSDFGQISRTYFPHDGEWHEVSYTFLVPSNITELSIGISAPTGSLNGEYIDIEWVKLELGDHATPYVPRLYAEELQLCQRYYQIVDTGESSCLGANTNDIRFNIRPPFKMRAKGTLIDNGLDVRKDTNTQSGFTFTFTKWDASIAFVSITASKSSHGVTYANYPTLGGTISIDAEL